MEWKSLEKEQITIWKIERKAYNQRVCALIIAISLFIFDMYSGSFLQTYHSSGIYREPYPQEWLEMRKVPGIIVGIFLLLLLLVFSLVLYRSLSKERKMYLRGFRLGIILYADTGYDDFCIRVPKNLKPLLNSIPSNANRDSEMPISEYEFERYDFSKYDYQNYKYT